MLYITVHSKYLHIGRHWYKTIHHYNRVETRQQHHNPKESAKLTSDRIPLTKGIYPRWLPDPVQVNVV